MVGLPHNHVVVFQHDIQRAWLLLSCQGGDSRHPKACAGQRRLCRNFCKIGAQHVILLSGIA